MSMMLMLMVLAGIKLVLSLFYSTGLELLFLHVHWVSFFPATRRIVKRNVWWCWWRRVSRLQLQIRVHSTASFSSTTSVQCSLRRQRWGRFVARFSVSLDILHCNISIALRTTF